MLRAARVAPAAVAAHLERWAKKMTTDERWNLDRKPTAIERGVGIGGALLLCVIGMVGLYFSVFVKSNLVASLATGAFTTLSMLFLVRFIFTGGRSLHRPEIIATAVVFTVVGLAVTFCAPSRTDRAS